MSKVVVSKPYLPSAHLLDFPTSKGGRIEHFFGTRRQTISMICRFVSQVLVVGLILLLRVELTGLTCLEERWIAAPANSVLGMHQITDVATEPGKPVNDGCPCHMVFVSILSGASQPSHPVSLLEHSVPGTPPLMPPFVPFHPPLSL